MFRILLVFLLLSGPSGAAFGQKVLQIETVNKARTVKIRTGETLIYRLKGDNEPWERSVINGLDVEKQAVIFGLMPIPVSEIDALKRPKRRFVQVIGGNLLVFGVTWVGFSALGELLTHDDISWNAAAIIGGTCIPAGWLMVRPRTLQMGNRHRLRILDLTIPGAAAEPDKGIP